MRRRYTIVIDGQATHPDFLQGLLEEVAMSIKNETHSGTLEKTEHDKIQWKIKVENVDS